MENIENLQSMLEKIEDGACQSIAKEALKIAQKALDEGRSDPSKLSDEIEKIVSKALKTQGENEAQ